MGRDFLVADVVLGNSLHVKAHELERLEHAGVDGLAAVGDDAHDDLFPPLGSPRRLLGTVAEVGDVLDDGVHRTKEEDVVIVVWRKEDEASSQRPVVGEESGPLLL